MLEVLAGRLNVHFLDYGNKATIRYETTEQADSQFFQIPPLAQKFVVAGVFPANGVSWTTDELNELQNNLLNAEFEGRVMCTGITGFPPLVRLLNFGSLTTFPSLSARWPSVPAAQQFSIGRSYTVFVTHFESVLSFFVQDSFAQDTLDRFHAALSNSVLNGTARCLDPSQCNPGVLCVARYKGSDQLYRAVVNDADWQGMYRVTFVDYGDSAVVKIADLWPIEERFLSLPIQALRCCATGQHARVSSEKLRSAFAAGCTTCIHISGVSSGFHLIVIDFESMSAISQPVVSLPSPVGTTGSRPDSVPRYVESSLAEGIWHGVCISSVEADGSFYVQLMSDSVSLNAMMAELASRRLQPIYGAVFDGMACVVRSSSDGCIYRAHVCIQQE